VGAEQAQRADHLVRRCPLFVAVEVRARADRCPEILGAPGQTGQAWHTVAIIAEREYRRRRFGRDRQDAHDACRQAMLGFEHIDEMGDGYQVSRSVGLGQHDAIGCSGYDGREIVEDHARIERIDAHVERNPGGAFCTQEVADHLACRRLAQRGDGIFQIEDDAISADTRRLRHLLVAVTGSEQE